ncbi:MAG TPA: disulfide bond formation protein B [Rhodanobacteraceae bacterium]|nr:disulfide bond formation protein B [Rhodanobacteraceae bacterium]
MARSTFISLRSGFLIGLLACAGVFAYALYVQFHLHIEPCPLCIVQRIVFIAMGVLFLIGAAHAPRAGGRWVYVVLIDLIALIGVGVAWRHLWLQSLPPDQVPSCGPGLSYMLDTFPIGQTIKMVFTGSGECAVVNWSFLGLAMPAWSLICFVVFGAWAILVAATSRRGDTRLAAS